MSDRARDLYVVYMGGTATAAQSWERGVVDADTKRRWERVASHVDAEQQGPPSPASYGWPFVVCSDGTVHDIRQ